MTINKFKRAIRQDGNLKDGIIWSSPRKYVCNMIKCENRLSQEQKQTLYDWAWEQFSEIATV